MDKKDSLVDESGDLRSASVLAMKLKDPTNIDEVKAHPGKVDALAREAIESSDRASGQAQYRRALESDRAVYRSTVLFLGMSIILSIFGIVGITLFNLVKGGTTVVPDSLVAVASAAVGALAGLLSPLGASK